MGVFMKVSKAATEMLKRVEPYLSYGYPNLKSVRELIYKRGSARSTSSVSHSTTTRSSRPHSASTASSAWRILCTRFTLRVPTSRRPTTSCGHSSSAQPRVVRPRSARASARVAKRVTARTRLTPSSRRCSKHPHQTSDLTTQLRPPRGLLKAVRVKKKKKKKKKKVLCVYTTL